MLQYMGRENLEDYDAAFLILLETWEAVIHSGLWPRKRGQSHEAIEIAKILGWTQIHPVDKVHKNPHLQLSHTARACNAAYSLITAGHMAREDFAGMRVNQAERIAENAVAIQTATTRMGRQIGTSPEQIEDLNKRIGEAASETAAEVQHGTIASADIAQDIHFRAMSRAPATPNPLLSTVANRLATALRRTLDTDANARTLNEMRNLLDQIEMREDWEALSRVRLELTNLATRATAWDKRLTPTKLHHLTAIGRSP